MAELMVHIFDQIHWQVFGHLIGARGDRGRSFFHGLEQCHPLGNLFAALDGAMAMGGEHGGADLRVPAI